MAAHMRAVDDAARTGRPVKGANFVPKRDRKRIRKGMARGYLANRRAEARNAAADRMAFYRKLRTIKMRRRLIAKEMARLAQQVNSLRGEVYHVADRLGDRAGFDHRYVAEAVELLKPAAASVQAAADEMWTFSRARVYYTEAVGH